ncbi:MAG: flagellar basal body P-ring formation chaperone FlgA [Pseudomonadota bacterium]
MPDYRQFIVTALLGLAAAPLLAGDAVTRTADIVSTARDFVLSRLPQHDDGLSVHVDPPDPRLRLGVCERALEAFAPPGYRPVLGRQVVGVRCTGARPWKLYVTATSDRIVPVVVARRRLNRGDVIRESDVELTRLAVGRFRQGYLTRLEAAVGRVVRQGVDPGELIAPGRIDRQRVVSRGQRVTLETATAGIRIRMGGVAQSAGGVGDRIEVRNVSSGRLVEGVVLSAERVAVTLN